MSDEDTELGLAALALLVASDALETPRRKRTVWVQPYLQRREEKSCYYNLMRELIIEDHERYRRFIRMDVATFELLLNLVRPKIEKQHTNFRLAISPGERLAVTLRHLATGESFYSLGMQFRMAHNTVAQIVLNVCKAICDVLCPDLLSVPRTETEWEKVAADFYDQWNFPNCLGALDGKHVQILPPPKSGALYRNYKGHFSIVLMALVDANLKFLYVDIGRNGCLSDSAVWGRCDLREALEDGNLNIPAARAPRNGTVPLPYVIVADEGFGLKSNLLRPYSLKDLDDEKRICNYRISRARRIVESAFGVLASRWQVYRSPMKQKPENVKLIVKATVVLHNLLLRCRPTRSLYSPPDYIDQEDILTGDVREGKWRENPGCLDDCTGQTCSQRNSAVQAKAVREGFCSYFNGPGQVSWQRRVLGLSD